MARNTSALPSSIENVIDENTSFSNINVNSSPKSVTSAGSKTPRRQAPGTPKTPLSASVANSSPLVASSPASSGRRTRKMWTEEEEALLISAVEKYGMDSWDKILQENQFNNRTVTDLKNKYRYLTRAEKDVVEKFAIFDIRSVNSKVTEVFYGMEWSNATWVRVEEIEPQDRFERLLDAFERKMQQKQKLVARVSPARTPSHLVAAMTLNSTAKKRRPVSTGSDSESSISSSPIRHETPLKKIRTLREATALHSDYSGSEDESSLVYPNQEEHEGEGEESEQPEATPTAPVKPSQSRCIIM